MLSRTVRLSAEKILRLPVQIDKAVLSCFKQADHRYASLRLKIVCLCRAGNGSASRAKRALFAACRRANPVGFTLGKQSGLEPLFACWGNLSPSPFERFLQNRLRSCGAFFACGASGNRGVEHFSPPYLWVAPPDDLAVLVGAVPDLRTVP